jgi:SRSO17 transposase
MPNPNSPTLRRTDAPAPVTPPKHVLSLTLPRRFHNQTHQSLHHVVAKAEWDDAAVLGAVREQVLPAMERHGPVAYWIVDDTGFPKQGKHSVGVARQYCGQLGKQDSCQVAVSLSVANDHASLPVAYRLYLPETWAEDPARRSKAGIPGEIGFETKTAIALGQMRQALACGVPVGVVLGDAGYGNETDFRTGVSALGLRYVLGVQPATTVWPHGQAPLPPMLRSGRGRPPTRLRRSPEHQPASVKTLATAQPSRAWHTVTWRQGTQAALSSRFAALRVRPAHRDETRTTPWPEEWLLVEWPEGEADPTKYWLSNLPPRTTLKRLVHAAKARWRIERDYQELKQEVGLGHYEGRSWRGFHHHASLCIAAYGFRVAERCLFPLKPASPQTGSRHLHYPKASSHAAPLRPERHVGTSIATVRRRLTISLVSTLPRCPCCLQARRQAEMGI